MQTCKALVGKRCHIMKQVWQPKHRLLLRISSEHPKEVNHMAGGSDL